MLVYIIVIDDSMIGMWYKLGDLIFVVLFVDWFWYVLDMMFIDGMFYLEFIVFIVVYK